MSGPQFMHVETYAVSVSKLRKNREAARAKEGALIDRKLTVEEICGEAARASGHCPHVKEVQAPVLLAGVSPDEVPALLDERIAAANEKIRAIKSAMPRGSRKSGPRAVRSDTHTLITFVASHPVPWRNPETGEENFRDPEDRAILEKWEQLNLAWARAKAEELGFELASVVRHEDEPYPHLHLLGIPANLRLEARSCHPGYMALEELQQDEGEDDKAFRRRRNRAYNCAMRALQDDYYEAVGLDSGLLRTGPKRQRLSTASYNQEKAAGRARALASVRTRQLAEEADRTKNELSQTKDLLAITEGDAVQAIVKAINLEQANSRLEATLDAKTAEIAALEQLDEDGRAMRAQFAADEKALAALRQALTLEEAALAKAKGERAEAEDAAGRARFEEAERRQRLQEEFDALDADRRRFCEEREEHQREVITRNDSLARREGELAAVVEGVEAFADGRLRFRPGDESQPLAFIPGPNGVDQDLKLRLAAVKPRLVPIVKKLDSAMSRYAEKLRSALTSAISGWSSGLLQGVGERREDGQPTFYIPETEEGDELLTAISPFREAVARLIEVLPDRLTIASAKVALSKLRPRLNALEQEDAREFETAVAHLEKRRGKAIE